jgi:flagellin-like protein
MFSKRGVSPVIATVLLIVLTLVIVGVLAVFVVPFTDKSLKGSDECFNVISKISFDESPYNCIGETSTLNRTGFSIRVSSSDIEAFKVTLFQTAGSAAGSAVSYDVRDGALNDNIRMLNSNFSMSLSSPGQGETLTYVARGFYDRIEVYPLLSSGSTCDEHDTIRVSRCVTPAIKDKLVSS